MDKGGSSREGKYVIIEIQQSPVPVCIAAQFFKNWTHFFFTLHGGS